MSIASFWLWFEETFFSSKKRVLSTAIIGILLLSMPVTLMLLNQRQDIRQRAASTDPSCLATTVKSFTTNQTSCNAGVSFYNMTVTCGDGYEGTKQYSCGFNNSGSYESDAAAICAARASLCATPTPRPPSPLPAPKQIACTKPIQPNSITTQESTPAGTEITFNMKEPIYAVADGPITNVEYVRGNWCAWAAGNDDPLAKGMCPLPCPLAPNSWYPFNISQDKLSFSSDFDYPYPDNTGSCTYSVTCTASINPENPSPSQPITPTPTCLPGDVCPSPPTATPTGGAIITITPNPSLSPNPNVPGVKVKLTVRLPGIGIHNLLGENNAPKHPNRSFDIFALDRQGKEVGQTSANLSYIGVDNTPISGILTIREGSYTGEATFSDLPSDTYQLKIKSSNSLIKAIPGTYNLSSSPIDAKDVVLVSGNLKDAPDARNIIDVDDYNIFLSCYKGENCDNKLKESADFNDDNLINSKDLNILLRGFATRIGD